jgi:pilus assembly protein CpaE
MGALMKFPLSRSQPASPAGIPASTGLRVSFTPDAFERGEPSEALREQFPHVSFRPMPGRWTSPTFAGDALMVSADAAKPGDIDTLCANLRESGHADQVIVLLQNADLAVTRRLVREGVFDVLTAPASDAALVVSLERLLTRFEAQAAQPRSGSEVIAFLKAGGGVGATSLAAQLAAIFATHDRNIRVCLADLDVQMGSAAVYLDLQDTVTMSQVLAAGKDLSEIRFSEALSRHQSGVRVLGDPQEFMPLEALTPAIVDNLISALRREFDIVLIDLPSAWTAWTDRALRSADRIVMVTHLSVPHAHLTRRQLKVMASQGLDAVPLTLVCNAVGSAAPAGVSVKAMEKAIGQSFDAVLPEERKLMDEAINQGVAIASIRKGTKLEKALVALAESLRVPAAAQVRKS